MKPVNDFEILETQFSTASNKLRMVAENQAYLAYLVGGNLTTSTLSYQYTTKGTTAAYSTAISTASSRYTTILSSTISWPGLEGKTIDQLELGLDAQFNSTAATQGFLWQIKNSTGSTWQSLHTVKTIGVSTAWPTRSMSGYRLQRDASLATGYNRLPINIRLRVYNKTASKGRVRVRNTSYVRITVR